MKGSAFKLNNVATKSALKHSATAKPHPHPGIKDIQTADGNFANQPGTWTDENTFVPVKDADQESYDIKDEQGIWSRNEEMEGGPQMKSPLEQKVAIGTTPADKKEYDREVGDYIRQSAIVKGSKKAEKLKKRRLAKEAKAAKGPKKGINIDFRKTKSNKRGTGGKIGIRLIPKITRKGRGINFN